MRIATHRHALPTQCTWAAFAAAGCQSRSGAGAKCVLQLTGTPYQHSVPGPRLQQLGASHTQVWVLSSALCSSPVRRTDTVCLGHAMQSLGTSHTLVRALSCAFCGSPVRRADTVCLGHSMRLCALVTPRRCATHLRLANTLCRHWVPWPRYAVAVCPSHTQVRTLGSAFCGLAVGSADTVCCGHAWCVLLRAPAPYHRARVPLLCV